MSPDESLSADAAVRPGGQRLSALNRRQLASTITAMATPVVLGQLSQTLMGLVDTLMEQLVLSIWKIHPLSVQTG